MTTGLAVRLDRALERLPRAYPGPGGAVAVLRNGEVLVRHAWGFANAERRIPFTPRTLFRICSITKQFTCALVLDSFPDPSVLNDDVRARLPALGQNSPSALHLCHNQSGLRDYWALAMLLGAGPEDAFGEVEAVRVIAAAQTLQFAPGTRYSYANQNFRILGDVLQSRADRGFSELLRNRIFEPIGMADAFLAADSRAMPDGTEGYEGTNASGFRPAENRILWIGDAGIGASLDDMIAWERYIDVTREDPATLYRRLTEPVRFACGKEAGYGFGVGRRTEFGRAVSGHGGALRGWRSHRLYAPTERVSVVVFFNHMSDAGGAARDLFAAMLGEGPPRRLAETAQPDWLGVYFEPETSLSVRIEAAPEGKVLLRFGHPPQLLDLEAGGASGDDGVRLRAVDGALWMDRPKENMSSLLEPRPGAPGREIEGSYHCGELAAELTIVDGGGAHYGAFSGALGQGRMELLEPIGRELWTLPCLRALDHTPPGDWTLAFNRDGGRPPHSVTVGCWLARGLRFDRRG